MVLNSIRYDMDPLKGDKTRDYHDANLRRATITLTVTGTLAGISIAINTPPRVAAGLGAITVAEPGDFLNNASRVITLQNLVAAIHRKTNGALRAKLDGPDGGVRLVGANAEVVLEAAQAGSWGEAITFVLAVTANAGNLTVNNNVGAGSYTPISGAGPDALLKFEAFLQGLGVTIDKIRVTPLFPSESSSFLVTWET